MRIIVALIFTTGLGAQPVQFNRQIRPLLSDRCFACHGPDQGNRKSPLRLDREADAKADLGQGRRGIIPGDAGQSGIFQRITSTNKGKRMPPAYAGHDALPAEQIALIKRWIEEGAPYEPHYSFVAPKRPPMAGIDSFVRTRLEREGLTPAAPASPRTLLRRVTLDLTGLPPSPAEMEAFLADPSPHAYERVVDRLLSSDRYAERMAIRWLEAARYADTNGYQTDGPRDMWRWRDWVIDAYRKNMPFDQFTIEQLAGDLLPKPTLAQKIATGFQRNHRTSAEGGIIDEEFRVEYVADRAETTSTVWLGLTLGCARCHDHKFDPLAQKDFYSMFAFYNSVPERGFVWNFGNEPPHLKAPRPAEQAKLNDFDDRLALLHARVAAREPEVARAQAAWAAPDQPWKIHDGLVLEGKSGFVCEGKCAPFDGKSVMERKLPKDAPDTPRFNNQDPFTFAAWIKPESGKGAIVSRAEDEWEGQQHGLYLVDGKLRLHIVFRWSDLGARVETKAPLELQKWQHVAATYDGSMRAAGIHLYVDGVEQPLNVLFDNLVWPIENKYPWRIGAGASLRFSGTIEEPLIYNRALSAEEVSTLPLKQTPAGLRAVTSKAAATKLRLAFLDLGLPEAWKKERAELKKLEDERAKYLETVSTVMVMQESASARQAYVLKRGAYDQHGEPVSPAIPSALPGWRDEWPKNRLGLAKWIVSRENPLTARVTVNRYWQMLFGTGLVKTVEDFGSQGEWPLDMELLDWLAVEFMENGWDTKAILKTIVMSATYRQSSQVTPNLLARDPENRLLARGPRLRISPEMVRDQALAISGLLVDRTGGPSVKPYQPPGLWQELIGGKGYVADQGEGLYRRSLYTYWKRTIAPPSMVNFDSPTRELCIVREGRTNTPLQALNLMNDVVYLEASRKLAERMLAAGDARERRLTYAYQAALGRAPKEAEMGILSAALEKFQKEYQQDPQAAGEYLKQGESPRDPRWPAPELAAYTALASLILNLDEVVTKE
ncbi:MAG: DUF1553 domain-containing protein [Bryobacteraceae bacterium]|nr:DUF1553 domain-containing protein [Bryobacteraceae bacterium]